MTVGIKHQTVLADMINSTVALKIIFAKKQQQRPSDHKNLFSPWLTVYNKSIPSLLTIQHIFISHKQLKIAPLILQKKMVNENFQEQDYPI